jgi:hypothetical protein
VTTHIRIYSKRHSRGTSPHAHTYVRHKPHEDTHTHNLEPMLHFPTAPSQDSSQLRCCVCVSRLFRTSQCSSFPDLLEPRRTRTFNMSKGLPRDRRNQHLLTHSHAYAHTHTHTHSLTQHKPAVAMATSAFVPLASSFASVRWMDFSLRKGHRVMP